jgi:tetratricopeptide (TPR) repeat protein
LAADYGLWVGSYVRGELAAMQEHAAAFLDGVAAQPHSPETSVAHRAAGVTHWFAGEYREARDCLEHALALFQPGRDDDLTYRFGLDVGVSAMINLATVLWPLGEVERAISLIDRAQERARGITHAGTLGFVSQQSALLEMVRLNRQGVARNALELARLARAHDLTMFQAFAVFLEGFVKEEAASGDGLDDMRRGVGLLRAQRVLMFDGLLKIALAEAEARAGDPDRAVAILDEALATSERTGYRAFEAELHRVRGEHLSHGDPVTFAPAEGALRTAIAVARQQGTRSFWLRAALSLAKLYQSTGRLVEAHAALAPALNGFLPTPEMREIAEAQALLATLAESTEVNTAIAERQRRLDLQTSYGQALMWAKGFAAEETEAAFARIGEFAGLAENATARFVAYYAQVQRSTIRGEFHLARETAEVFLREAEAGGRGMEASVARRTLGMTLLFQGDLGLARSLLERALADFMPERDAGARFQFGTDSQVAAAAMLALVEWHLGEVARARQLSEQAIRRADELGHAASAAIAFLFKTFLESRRNDASATRLAADGLLRAMEGHGIVNLTGLGQMYSNWAQGRLFDPEAGASELRQTLTAYIAQGHRGLTASLHGLLAELEATTRGPDSALPLIDQGLSVAAETGEHLTDAYLHRLRGEILLKRDPANFAPSEEAFQTAIAIAEEQGARSYVLLASLSLAKLYQSDARPADAQAVLAPALEGFSPTPEMPEIAEARALLLDLAQRTA